MNRTFRAIVRDGHPQPEASPHSQKLDLIMSFLRLLDHRTRGIEEQLKRQFNEELVALRAENTALKERVILLKAENQELNAFLKSEP